MLKINKNKTNSEIKNSIKNFKKLKNLKLEIINKGAGLKREYKLTSNIKYEQFYDYFSFELRSCELLHIVNKDVETSIIDKKIILEQIFKVRDILISHIDQNYHSKVMHL